MTYQIQILRENKALLNTVYDATAQQNRVFMYILYKLQMQKNNQKICSCTIAGEELREIISDKNKRSVDGIKKILNQLVETTLMFQTTQQVHTYTLIAGYQYAEISDKYKIEVVEELYQYIVDSITTGQEVELQKLLGLKTQYAQKLFEVLEYHRQGKAEESCELDINWIRGKLGVGNQEYIRYTEFKERVLKTAVQWINDACVLEVKYEEVKEKRQTISIRFYFKIISNTISVQKEATDELKEDIDTKSELPAESVEIDEHTVQQEVAMRRVLEDLSMSRKLYPVFMKDFGNLDFSSDVVVNVLLYAEAMTLEETNKNWIHEEEYPEFNKWVRYYQQHTELFC